MEEIGSGCLSGILDKWKQMITATSGLLREAFGETDNDPHGHQVVGYSNFSSTNRSHLRCSSCAPSG